MKKILSVLIALLALAIIGCRGGEPPADSRPTPITLPAAGEGGGAADTGGGVGEDIALRLWIQDNDKFVEAYSSLVAAYTAANPGVTITLEAFDIGSYDNMIQTALTAGTAADLIQLPGSSTCVYEEYLSPLPENVTTLADSQSTFAAIPLSNFVCNGVLYGLPQEMVVPWGLVVGNTGETQEVAWDFVRFAALDPVNAAGWNTITGTQSALLAPQ